MAEMISGGKAGVGITVGARVGEGVWVALAVAVGREVTVTFDVTVICEAGAPQAISKNKIKMPIKIVRMGFLQCRIRELYKVS